MNCFVSSAEQGDIVATFILLNLLYGGHIQQEQFNEIIIHSCEQAAEGGGRLALYCWAKVLRLELGGVDQDLQRAVEYYQRSADMGYSGAQHNLAHQYSQGLGVQEDHERAAFWREEAANQENARSQYFTGLRCLKKWAEAGGGDRIREVFMVGLSWWCKSASHGYPTAKRNLRDLGSILNKRNEKNEGEHSDLTELFRSLMVGE